MMNNHSAPFTSNDLDEMRRGTVELSVPLRNDVIQVGARGEVEIGRLRVSKGRRTVTVIRVDGKPIQVDIINEARKFTMEGLEYELTKSNVFHEPVGELRLTRMRDQAGRATWYVAGGYTNITHQKNIKQFADTIAAFALAKREASGDRG